MNTNVPSVLIVDDDSECLAFAKAVLVPHYAVRTASSVEQCRAEIEQEKPDLILLDVMMPHLNDGLDFTRELKASGATSDIPVIMLTSVNEVYDYRSEIDASFFPHDRWLDKPVEPGVLLEAVAKVLGKGRSLAL